MPNSHIEPSPPLYSTYLSSHSDEDKYIVANALHTADFILKNQLTSCTLQRVTLKFRVLVIC